MSFQELNPWTPGTRGVESPTLNLLRKWHKLRIPDPCQVDGVWGGQCTVWEFIVKLHQIKANQTSIQHHNNMLKKSMNIRTWSKLMPERLGSERGNFTLRNRFSWTFKALKPMSFQGLLPWTPLGALRQAPGPHPCWASRQGHFWCGLCPHVIPHLGIRGKYMIMCPPPQHPAHATVPMQPKPGIHVQWGRG